jgi:hypothetical protein
MPSVGILLPAISCTTANAWRRGAGTIADAQQDATVHPEAEPAHGERNDLHDGADADSGQHQAPSGFLEATDEIGRLSFPISVRARSPWNGQRASGMAPTL